jgi:hypothetical protein
MPRESRLGAVVLALIAILSTGLTLTAGQVGSVLLRHLCRSRHDKAHDFIFQRLGDDQLAAAIETTPPGADEGSPRVFLEAELLDGAWALFDLVEGPNGVGRSRGGEVTIDRRPPTTPI